MNLFRLAMIACMFAGAKAAYVPGGWMLGFFGAMLGLMHYGLVGVLLVLFAGSTRAETDDTRELSLLTRAPIGTRIADFFRLTLFLATLPVAVLISLPVDESAAALRASEKALLSAAILLAAFLALCALPLATWEVCRLIWASVDYH